ncbi:hypothetical protein HUB94_20245 (plasmid) [Paenibacillus cellulosilyticus]|uniref:glycoside hydrolase family 78 protein n=1 Tax=Paenibacillus cellulosilyticus TaxID=375489 RepID=UPI000D711FDF|nr:PKD domain-containing protein [Paenibacillus cellulosilyticus]QKS46816.1 hypothetical protein HUB94_20245 [Paenibacillus cellulosilyticus]
MLFEFQLDGRESVHYYLTDGTNIDADFTNQSRNVTQGESLGFTPATNAKYTYNGYKKSTVGPPSGGSIFSGNPPDVTYDGTYDIYHVNLYYTKKSEAQAYIRHVDRDGNPISELADKDRDEPLVKNAVFSSTSAAAPSGYTYAGYVKTATVSGSAPTDFNNPTAGEYAAFTFEGNFTKLYLYYVYDKDASVTIRHVDRSGVAIPGMSDIDKSLKLKQTYTFTHTAAPSGYTYAGYAKTTTGTLPTAAADSTPTPGEFPTLTYNGGFKKLYLDYVYDIDQSANMGIIHVRHMVRTGPTGTYTKANEESVVVPNLTDAATTKTLSANTTYGTYQGRSSSKSGGYSDSIITIGGSAVTVSLTKSSSEAWVSFYYEKTADFTADFDVTPASIKYRESFKLHPKDWELNGCTYVGHYYKIERDGSTWTSSMISGMTTDSTYSYSSYPWNIGVGVHEIYMKVVTSCGTSNWIGPKTLTVTDDSNNDPPEFQLGFVYNTARTKPIAQVTEGSIMDLTVIMDSSVPTPYDPNGDTITFAGYDLSSADEWLQNKISSSGYNYTTSYIIPNITMDEVGFHYITAYMRDSLGAMSKATTSIEVVPKNPVPVAVCPEVVTANHPVDQSLFDASKSYSPISRKIDHTLDEWTNKQTAYTNDTDHNITVIVELGVTDEKGLHSLSNATCTIIVKPDLPPIAKLNVPAKAVRDESANILNESYSPDGDEIVKVEYQFKYDTANNGFDDDAWQKVYGSMQRIVYSPSKVGKYWFYVKVTDEYGLTAETNVLVTDGLVMDVVNNAPSVSFTVEGKNEQPDLEPYTQVKPETMLNWPVYVTGSSTEVFNKNNLWRVSGNNLVSGEARNSGSPHQYFKGFNYTRGSATLYTTLPAGFQDNGYGPNNLSPWRSSTDYDSTQTNPILDETAAAWKIAAQGTVSRIRSNKKYLYYDTYNSTTDVSALYAVDINNLPQLDYEVCGWVICPKYKSGTTPFAFKIIGLPSFSKTTTYNTKTGTATGPLTYSYVEIDEWELAGDKIYVRALFQATNKYTPAGESSSKTQTFSVYDLLIYDAFTGSLIDRYAANEELQAQIATIHDMTGNTGAYGLGSLMKIISTNGDRVVFEARISGVTAPEVSLKVMFELLPDLSVQYKATWSTAPKLGSTAGVYVQVSDMFFDPTGAMYFYEGYGATTAATTFSELYVTKYNADYTFAWRTALGSGGPAYTATTNASYVYPNNVASLMINYDAGTLYAKKYYDYRTSTSQVTASAGENVYVINTKTGAIKQTKSLENGDNLDMYAYSDGTIEAAAKFYVNHDGTTTSGNPSTTTIDGYHTSRKDATCTSAYNVTGVKSGYNSVRNDAGQEVGRAGVTCIGTFQIFGEYVGDGIYASLTKNETTGTSDGFYLTLSKGTPTTTPVIRKSFTSGQFYSTDQLANAEMKISFTMKYKSYDTETLGFSFRMQNPEDRYAFETDGSNVMLAKYENGQRTLLDSSTYAFEDGKSYSVKLLTRDARLQAFIGNVPLFDVKDSTYTTGRYGYFSDKSFVTFGAIQYKDLGDTAQWSTDYAIWDETTQQAEVAYKKITYEDPENDPSSGDYQWTIAHTPRFINNQGLSALDGQTFTAPQLTFDKVGDYLVALQAQDDPNPSYLMPMSEFDEYRAESDPYIRKITVHRRPVSDYEIVQQASDGVVKWTDHSYDPDRYESATNYSTEDTGIDYKTTRGILEKRFYYITPSGEYVAEKLLTPQEIGQYEVGMAVRDEYGAWSAYTVKMLDVTMIAVLNTPPVAGFTTSHITTYRGVTVTFDSTAHDKEDGGRENLEHEYYLKNLTTNSAESLASKSRTSWTKSFSTLGTFKIRQTVTDSVGASDQFELQVTVKNRLPVPNITTPSSSDQTNPTKLDTLRPTFKWTYSDADGDEQSQYQLRIYRYGGVLQADTYARAGSAVSFVPNADLPESTNMYVIVRVYDGYEWSDWSDPKFFNIVTNRPPVADFDWLPKPAFEGDDVKITNTSTDPDNDTLTSQWSIQYPDGTVKLGSSTDMTISGADTVNHPGAYVVTLTVTDPKGAADTITKTIQIGELGITGIVTHTEDWEQHRKDWNNQYPDSQRSEDTFWAGERFVLKASTTDTGAIGTNASSVSVTAVSIGSTTLSSSDRVNWTGYIGSEQADVKLESLKDGQYKFIFVAKYPNGVVKTTSVLVNISGKWTEYFKFHQSW